MPLNTKESLPQSFDQARLDAIVEILSCRYTELFEALEVNLSKTAKMYIGCCPIHGGDNHSALNLYTDGYSVKGFWKCRTKHCEQVFKKTLIGFIRGVLSNRKGWSGPNDIKHVASFRETIDWICNFLGKKFQDIKINSEEVSNKKFANQVNSLIKQKEKPKGITRTQVRESLEIPAKFFVDKGFSKQILDNYDVGLCKNPGKEMYNRVVAPIYDEDRKFMVACTGRSIYPKCEKCKYYHNPQEKCPEEKYRELKYSKWRNSGNSSVSSYLYNFWSSKKFIKETGTVILVEGPADVWKLEELGIHNSVALFGTEISDEQQIILEMSGVFNVVILLDMDKAGKEGTETIKKKIERSYRVFCPQLSVNDPGDFTEQIVEEELLPILKGLRI
jgi:5S rRNA maturation endonuclease (ribonuclease M5)